LLKAKGGIGKALLAEGVGVSAGGLTVYFITRMLDKRKR
jgi:hypothetical protein